MKVKVKQLAVCPCGMKVFSEEVKVGDEFEVDDKIRIVAELHCGKCKTKADLICVPLLEGGPPLPVNLFEIEACDMTKANEVSMDSLWKEYRDAVLVHVKDPDEMQRYERTFKAGFMQLLCFLAKMTDGSVSKLKHLVPLMQRWQQDMENYTVSQLLAGKLRQVQEAHDNEQGVETVSE